MEQKDKNENRFLNRKQVRQKAVGRLLKVLEREKQSKYTFILCKSILQ
jgi:hypothetical protein